MWKKFPKPLSLTTPANEVESRYIAAWPCRKALLASPCPKPGMPAGPVAGWPFPIHQIAITAIGIHLIDNLHLLHLAEACAAAGRWSFQLSVSPLRVVGGTGCPVNPIALL